MIRALACAGFWNGLQGPARCHAFRVPLRRFAIAVLCAARLLGNAAAADGGHDTNSPSYNSVNHDGNSTFNDAAEYTVLADTKQLGKIAVIPDKVGVFVQPANILRLVGMATSIDPDTHRIDIVLKNGATITLDPDEQNYKETGARHDTYDSEVVGEDGDIYVSFELLNRILPAPLFLVNQAEHKIDIAVSQCTGADRWCQLGSIAAEAAPPSSRPTAAQQYVATSRSVPADIAPSKQSFIVDNSDNPSAARPEGTVVGKPHRVAGRRAHRASEH